MCAFRTRVGLVDEGLYKMRAGTELDSGFLQLGNWMTLTMTLSVSIINSYSYQHILLTLICEPLPVKIRLKLRQRAHQ